MDPTDRSLTSRRDFLKTAGSVVAASALTGVSIPPVHAAGSDLVQHAIVGCGGRGGGAVMDALATKGGPTKLIAMADAYADRLQGKHSELSRAAGSQMDVPPERRFVGFDAYRKAMDCLK